MSQVKSLRDNLLKSAVVNFNEIFFEYDQESGKAMVKKNISLPPRLFEDIQYKSLEMYWIIPHESLKTCLSSRQSLHWMNVNLTMGSLEEEDLMNIENSDFPLQSLSFQTFLMTDIMMDVIRKYSSTIEILEILYPLLEDVTRFENEWKYKRQVRLTPKTIQFKKLKKLCIHVVSVTPQRLCRINLSSCSNSLKIFALHDSRRYNFDAKDEEMIKSFFRSAKALHNLETFVFEMPNYYEHILDTIVHLKNLRTLSISSFNGFGNPKPNDIKFVEQLPKLENLTISSKYIIGELNSLNGKVLEYAGTDYHPIPENIETFTKEWGSYEEFQSCLNCLDDSCPFYTYLEKRSCMIRNIPSWLNEIHGMSAISAAGVLKKVEKLILDFMRWRYFDSRPKMRDVIDKSELWSQDFIEKLTYLLISSRQCEEPIREHYKSLYRDLIDHTYLIDSMEYSITLNPNSRIAKLFAERAIDLLKVSKKRPSGWSKCLNLCYLSKANQCKILNYLERI